MAMPRNRGVGILALFAGVISVAGCQDPLANAEDSQLARNHLDRILELMETNSVNRNSIDWPTFRTTVFAKAPDPGRLDETFDAIFTALGLLGDNHSSYVAPPEYGISISNSKITCTASAVLNRTVPPDIGYARVASLSSASGTPGANSYSSTLHAQIRARDTSAVVAGWVVDLRGNMGGNMWPMIAGLGPILGENTVGFFINPAGSWSTWEYRDFAAKVNGSIAQSVTNPYTLRRADPKVAVLIDGRVASSGEAAAIAFKGRPNTRFFGLPTCGLSTANVTFSVDGASLVLTVAKMADRTRFVYGDTLVPDEVIPDSQDQLDRAIAWLREPTSAVTSQAHNATLITGRTSAELRRR